MLMFLFTEEGSISATVWTATYLVLPNISVSVIPGEAGGEGREEGGYSLKFLYGSSQRQKWDPKRSKHFEKRDNKYQNPMKIMGQKDPNPTKLVIKI